MTFTINGGYVSAFSIELTEIVGNSCIFNRGGSEIGGSGNFYLPPDGRPAIVADGFTFNSIAPAYVYFDSGDYGPPAKTGDTKFTLTGTLAGDSGEGSGDFAFSAGTCVAHSVVRWSIVRVA